MQNFFLILTFVGILGIGLSIALFTKRPSGTVKDGPLIGIILFAILFVFSFVEYKKELKDSLPGSILKQKEATVASSK
jgi:hypothetical protein